MELCSVIRTKAEPSIRPTVGTVQLRSRVTSSKMPLSRPTLPSLVCPVASSKVGQPRSLSNLFPSKLLPRGVFLTRGSKFACARLFSALTCLPRYTAGVSCDSRLTLWRTHPSVSINSCSERSRFFIGSCLSLSLPLRRQGVCE